MSQEQKTIVAPAADEKQPGDQPIDPQRKGAAGKALIVWLATGSFGAAVVAFIIFKVMGC